MTFMEVAKAVMEKLEIAQVDEPNRFGSYGIVAIGSHLFNLYPSVRVTLSGSIVQSRDNDLYMLSQISSDVYTFICLTNLFPNGNRYKEGVSFKHASCFQDEINLLKEVGLSDAVYVENMNRMITTIIPKNLN